MSENQVHPVDCRDGWIDCWWCWGEGYYDEPLDDITDHTVVCRECHGRGGWPCPVCDEAVA